MTIQGRRMPSRKEVRSLNLPKNGLPTMATKAPIPVTTAKLLGACSMPTSELTFKAKVTRCDEHGTVPRYANVYSEMKPKPTRFTAGDSGSSAASAGARYSNPSSPAVGGRWGSCWSPIPLPLPAHEQRVCCRGTRTWPESDLLTFPIGAVTVRQVCCRRSSRR